eukprot:500074_1
MAKTETTNSTNTQSQSSDANSFDQSTNINPSHLQENTDCHESNITTQSFDNLNDQNTTQSFDNYITTQSFDNLNDQNTAQSFDNSSDTGILSHVSQSADHLTEQFDDLYTTSQSAGHLTEQFGTPSLIHNDDLFPLNNKENSL